MVERDLAKVEAAGSKPVSRSKKIVIKSSFFIHEIKARVVELVDTRDLKSLGYCIRAGSSPASSTTILWRHSQVVRRGPAKP